MDQNNGTVIDVHKRLNPVFVLSLVFTEPGEPGTHSKQHRKDHRRRMPVHDIFHGQCFLERMVGIVLVLIQLVFYGFQERVGAGIEIDFP